MKNQQEALLFFTAVLPLLVRPHSRNRVHMPCLAFSVLRNIAHPPPRRVCRVLYAHAPALVLSV